MTWSRLCIVTIMLIPQSLAYALLAGLPAEMGIYASIAPIILYAIFGTSRALAVGPVAVVSLMTAAAVGKIADQGSADYIAAAITLAFLSGGFLVLMGIFRLGFLANFLSHPVIAGFITASGIIIAASQLEAHFRYQGGRADALSSCAFPARESRLDKLDHADYRGRNDCIPVLGTQEPETAFAAHWFQCAVSRYPGKNRTGSGDCGYNPAGLGT